MTQPLPPLPAAWRRRGDRPDDESHLDNLARQLAHRRDLGTLPWLFAVWALAFAAATPALFGGHPAAWVAVGLFGVLAAASALGASGLRHRWRREGMPLEYATPWPRGGYSDRTAVRSLLVTAAVLAATTLFVALGGSDGAVLPQAVALAVAVLAFAVTLVLPGVLYRRRRFQLLQDAVVRRPDVVPRLQASLDAAARPRSAAGRVPPFAPPGFPVECLGLAPAQPAAPGGS